jgi:EmrB/QacA subfamily drug resistance transporter
MVEYKWKLLFVTTIGAYMSSLDASIVNIALPAITNDLDVPFSIIEWVPIIYLLMQAISLVAFGRLGDLHGRKSLYLWGLGLFTLASLFNGLSRTGEYLIIWRAVQGLGASLISSQSIAMITAEFPTQERGKALGINVASIYLGLVTGPGIGGFLVQYFGWQSIFYINIPIGCLLIPASIYFIRKSEPNKNAPPFDFLGMILFGVFLGSLLLLLSLVHGLGWGNAVIWLLFGTSLIGFLSFLWFESHIPAPMLKLTLFRSNRVFAAANLTALFNYIALSGISFLFSIYLQAFLGFKPSIAGLIMIPTPIAMVLLSPLSGRLSDKIGTRFLSSLGMTIIGIAITFMILIVLYLPWPYFILSQILLGCGSGLFSSPNQSAIMGSVEKKDSGIASGTLSTMRVTGQSLSVALLSSIVGIFIPSSILNPILANQDAVITPAYLAQFNQGLTYALAVSVGICILGVITSLARGKEKVLDS